MREERNLVFLAQNPSPPFGCYMCNSGIVALECNSWIFLKATFLSLKAAQTQQNVFEQSGSSNRQNLLRESNLIA